MFTCLDSTYDSYTLSLLKQLDIIEYNKRINKVEDEKLRLNEEILSIQHEKKNLLIQLQLLQNRLTSDETSNDVNLEDTIQLNSSRQLPLVYRRAFERQLLSYHTNDDKQDEEVELNNDHEQKSFEDIINELNTLSLDQRDFMDLIARTITRINFHLNGSKKLVSESNSHFVLSRIKYFHEYLEEKFSFCSSKLSIEC